MGEICTKIVIYICVTCQTSYGIFMLNMLNDAVLH